jgi:MFS family permease
LDFLLSQDIKISTMPSEPPMTAATGKEPEFKEVELEIAIPTVSLESRTSQGFHHDARTGRRIITEREAWEHTAYNYTKPRKWSILLILWMIQITMNMNGSIWASTEDSLSSYYGVPINKISFGNMTFLISYAFGCEIWAPWSEELGRKWLMQASLLLVSIFTAMVPFAPSFTGVILLRLFTGLATAGGSLTLGVVADMYKANEQQNPVAFVAWGSMLGSSLPPMIGGIMECHLGVDSRRWCFWLISLCGVFVQIWHLAAVPETYYKKALNKCAKQRREKARQEGIETLDSYLYGPTEGIPIRERFNAKEIGVTMWRPFKFLLVSNCIRFL